MAEYTEHQIDKIVTMREKGKHWAEIAAEVGGTQGKAMLAHETATLPSKERFKFKEESDLKRKIADARKAGMSWGKIMARSGKSEIYCRNAYTEVTGNDAAGDRIGKGGRHPGGGEAPTKAKGAKAKTAAKATGVVKQAAKKAPAKVAKKVAKKAAAAKATAKKTTAKKAVASAA